MDPQRRTWRRTAVALAALLLTLAASRVAAADTITLMWDANPDPSVSGYIVYVGTQPGTYTQNVQRCQAVPGRSSSPALFSG